MECLAADIKRPASVSPHASNPNLPNSTAELNGAEILVRCLRPRSVEFVWGYPGGAVLYIYDEMYKQERSSTSWCATNRPPSMPPTPIRARPARSASRS